MIDLSEYGGLRDVALERNHLVVGLYSNVLWPPRNNHRRHARDARRVFDELSSAHPRLPHSYKVCGHSVGGKIALLLTSIVDPKRVSAVLALDPVDINPVEFSHERGSNLPLDDGGGGASDSVGPLAFFSGDGPSDAVHIVMRADEPAAVHPNEGEGTTRVPIVMTRTDGGLGIPKAHDAAAIHALHPATSCVRHAGAGHMAYCDNGGGLPGRLMPDFGTREGNERAREGAKELLRSILG